MTQTHSPFSTPVDNFLVMGGVQVEGNLNYQSRSKSESYLDTSFIYNVERQTGFAHRKKIFLRCLFQQLHLQLIPWDNI